MFVENKDYFQSKEDMFFTINMLLVKESNSCHKTSILVTGNQFLSQKINCNKKNSVSLVKLALSTCGIVCILPKRTSRFPMNILP